MKIFTDAIRTEEVAGITIRYSSSQGYEIWRNGEFCNLPSAFEKGWLTKSDVETISKL